MQKGPQEGILELSQDLCRKNEATRAEICGRNVENERRQGILHSTNDATRERDKRRMGTEVKSPRILSARKNNV